MNDFSQFLYTRRKALGLTQQNIADKLNITNKAVSKWESGECFPETAQLVALADILECSVDELLRGRFAEKETAISAEENAQKNLTESPQNTGMPRPLRLWQGLCIGVGVALVLFGVVALLLIVALKGETEQNELLGVAVMFAFFAVAVFLFVFAGVSHGVTDVVEQDKKPQAKLCALGLGVGVGFIIASIIFVLLLPEILGVAIMLSVMALGVAVIVFSGVGISRFNLPKEDEKESPWSGVIMMIATVVFLLCGFLWGKWHPAWVVFPVGGILCGIVETVIHAFKNK